MVVMCALDIFHRKISTLMEELKYIRTYLGDIFVLSRGSFEVYFGDIERVLIWLRNSGFKVDEKNLVFEH